MHRYHMINGEQIPFTTEEELARDAEEARFAEKQAELAKTQYQRDRATEYPPVTDYLDGIVKGDTAQVDKYIADCQVVKAKYPKGE